MSLRVSSTLVAARQTALAAWPRRFLVGAAIVATALVAGVIHYIYFDSNQPARLEAFSRLASHYRHVYDVNCGRS